MPKTIYLIRHGKASREFSRISDLDRPLLEKGCLESDKMSSLLKEYTKQIDLFISSPAVRAYSTAIIFARQINYSLNNILLEKKMYMAGSNDLLQVIKNLSEQYQSVAMFTHNPGAERLVKLLTSQSHIHFNTSAYAIIETNALHWNDIEPESCKLLTYCQPKEITYT